MHPAAPLPRHAAPDDASAVLGSEHPLTRVMRAEQVLGRHALAVVLMLAAALAGWAERLAWAPAAAIGAAAALLALGVVAAVLRQRAHWEALELIAEGREGLPIAPVERERRRLLGSPQPVGAGRERRAHARLRKPAARHAGGAAGVRRRGHPHAGGRPAPAG